MTISMENLSGDLEPFILQNLEDLCNTAGRMRTLIRAKGSCEDIFRQFTVVKKTIKTIENLLLTSQLKNCFLVNIPYMDELFTTLQALSSKRYGALIVIEQEDDVEKIINKNNLGLVLDAKLSGKLLESIFVPGTPLHDGAVIIRRERIFSAGSVLPLSTQIVTGKKLGTRHRAALGLSEISDAVAIVVSEETKEISIAIKGELLLIENISKLSVS